MSWVGHENEAETFLARFTSTLGLPLWFQPNMYNLVFPVQGFTSFEPRCSRQKLSRAEIHHLDIPRIIQCLSQKNTLQIAKYGIPMYSQLYANKNTIVINYPSYDLQLCCNPTKTHENTIQLRYMGWSPKHWPYWQEAAHWCSSSAGTGSTPSRPHITGWLGSISNGTLDQAQISGLRFLHMNAIQAWYPDSPNWSHGIFIHVLVRTWSCWPVDHLTRHAAVAHLSPFCCQDALKFSASTANHTVRTSGSPSR